VLRLTTAETGFVGTVTVSGGGTWQVGPTVTLDEGVYTYFATATDRVGNVSEPSLPFVVIVDEPGNPTPLPDLLVGNDQANQIQGLDGNDTIFGFGGNDTVKGNNGNDSLMGGDGHDRLEGENGNDALLGEAGNDSLLGGNGRDRADGGAGTDRLEGGADNDSLFGGLANDTLFGGAGSDLLSGDAGADRLSGDDGGDRILLGDDGARDSVFGSVAHLSGDTLDGFVGGAPTSPGADVLIIQGLSAANAKKLDGDAIVNGVLSLAEVGGGSITFENLLNPGTLHIDTGAGSGGEVLLYVV
jgi:Ca2+-binding RTX toxin-like protein